MRSRAKLLWAVLGVLIGLGSAFIIRMLKTPSSYPALVAVEKSLPAVLSFLSSVFLISLLLESLIEVLIKIFDIGSKSEDETIDDKKARENKTIRFSIIVGFFVAFLISISGIRTMDLFFDFESNVGEHQTKLFHVMDVFLTAALLTGGSDGVHRITNMYKKFIQGIQEQMGDSSTDAAGAATGRAAQASQNTPNAPVAAASAQAASQQAEVNAEIGKDG